MALGDLHSRLNHPYSPRIDYSVNYKISGGGLLPLFFPVRKFFQTEVQFSVGFLTRPVTRNQSCYGARYDEYTNDYQCCLYHASVPCMLPRTRDIMIAEMNTPAMMYTKSI